MGDGTRAKPYTRKDVLRLIKENGGKAEGLDLSGKIFEGEIDLSGLDLYKIILTDAIFPKNAHLEGAYLVGAHLENVYLNGAHLEGAILVNANLEGAQLWEAHLEGARLFYACLKGAFLREAYLEGTILETVDWGNFILHEENLGHLQPAEHIYRRLKQWHMEHGLYNVAGKFFYREMEVRRKVQSWGKKPHLKLWYWAMRLLCGYGEKPERVAISAAVIIFGLAVVYYFWGSFTSSSFWDTLYYSVASFTALGYGQWAPQPTGWAKGVGAAEAVLGVSMLALFLVTFTRKVSR